MADDQTPKDEAYLRGQQVIRDTQASVDATAQAAQQAATDAANATSQAASDAAAATARNARAARDGVAQGANDMANATGEFVSDSIASANRNVVAARDTVVETFYDAGQSIQDGAVRGVGNAVIFGENLARDARAARDAAGQGISDAYTGTVDYAEATRRAAAQGLNDMGQSIQDGAVRGVGNAVIFGENLARDARAARDSAVKGVSDAYTATGELIDNTQRAAARRINDASRAIQDTANDVGEAAESTRQTAVRNLRATRDWAVEGAQSIASSGLRTVGGWLSSLGNGLDSVGDAVAPSAQAATRPVGQPREPRAAAAPAAPRRSGTTIAANVMDRLEALGFKPSMDENRDGQISRGELNKEFRELGLTMRHIDPNRDGIATSAEVSNAINAGRARQRAQRD